MSIRPSGGASTGGTGTSSQALTPTAVKTANYTAAAQDFVPVDTTSGAVTVTLPTAPADKTQVGVKHVTQGGTNAVTVALGGSDVVNKAGGVTSFTMPLLAQAVILQYKASSAIWYVLEDDLPLTQLDARFQATGLAALKANNLSDLASAATARTNLGLATVAATGAYTDLTGRPTVPTARTVVSKTSAYTAVDGDVVLASAASAAFTVTLPAASTTVRVTVKKTDSTTNVVTVAPASGTIDGATTVGIPAQYVSRDFVSDGTNWFLV